MVDRPDLDEFLGALNGFLDKKSDFPQQDPSYLRFLEIFCRSVGSAEGHLLQYVDGKGLQSVVTYGVPEKFENRFNAAMLAPQRELSPVDSAFRDQQVMAVVELKRGAPIPLWFMEIADEFKFRSLVAVPLVGQTRPVGVLCAYYRDACLFDQATLDRLMTIGKMVGAAIEKSMKGTGAEINGSATDSAVDLFLELLTTRAATSDHVYEALIQVLAKSLAPSGLICGPIRMMGNNLSLIVDEGTGIPPDARSQRFIVPAFLAQPLMLGKGNKRQPSVPLEQWGSFRTLVSGKSVASIVQPIVWQRQPHAAIVAWRSDKMPFTAGDEALVTRIAGITALALRAI